MGKSQSWIFEKNSGFGDICKKVSKLALVGWLVGNTVFSFSEMAVKIFLIFLHEVRGLQR